MPPRIERTSGPSRLSHTGVIDTGAIQVKTSTTPNGALLLAFNARRDESADFR
jgi:hypothetical protein